jgi:hypothetical protein
MVDVLGQDRLSQSYGCCADPVRATGRRAMPQRRDPAAAEQAAPFAHGADVHPQAGGDGSRAPARQRARARSASLRRADLASAPRAVRASSSALIVDLPGMVAAPHGKNEQTVQTSARFSKPA